MVDIINCSLGVDKLYKVLDNLYDISIGEHACLRVNRKIEFLVQTIAAHVAEVISLFREEEFVNHIPGSALIRRF